MKRINATIDNKNLLEDPFEDEVFRDFYWAPDHRTGSRRRHLIGSVKTENYDAIVEVKWSFGDAAVEITVAAIQPSEDYELVRDEVFDHYEKIFKAWECEDNEDLRVETQRVLGSFLRVSFYFECE